MNLRATNKYILAFFVIFACGIAPVIFYGWGRRGNEMVSYSPGKQHKSPQKAGRRFEVILKSVNPEKNFIIVETSKGTEKIYYDKSTYFFMDGKVVAPEKLKVGKYIGILVTGGKADYVTQGEQKCTGERTVNPTELPMRCVGKQAGSGK